MSERESVKRDVRGSDWNLRIPLGQQLSRRGMWTWFLPPPTPILPPHLLTIPMPLSSSLLLAQMTLYCIKYTFRLNILNTSHLYMYMLIFIYSYDYWQLNLYLLCSPYKNMCLGLLKSLCSSLFFLCVSQSASHSSTSPVSSLSLLFYSHFIPSFSSSSQVGWRRATSKLLRVPFPHPPSSLLLLHLHLHLSITPRAANLNLPVLSGAL